MKDPEGPFVSFKCLDCGQQVDLFDKVSPGEAAVLKCENCSVTWVVYNPSLLIRKANEIPQNIQKQVWGHLSQEPL